MKPKIYPEYIGKACICQKGIIGIVTGIRCIKDGIVYYGYKLGHPSIPWFSKHPILIKED